MIRYSRGQPERRFERKPGARAEAHDCLVYAFSARSGVPIQFDQRENELRGSAVQKRPATIRSKWLDYHGVED